MAWAKVLLGHGTQLSYSSGNDFVKRNVFNCLLKEKREVAVVTLVGRLFHVRAAITRKHLSPESLTVVVAVTPPRQSNENRGWGMAPGVPASPTPWMLLGLQSAMPLAHLIRLSQHTPAAEESILARLLHYLPAAQEYTWRHVQNRKYITYCNVI